MKTAVRVIAGMIFIIALLVVSCGALQTTESEIAVVGNESLNFENELIGVWELTGETIEYPPDMDREAG